MLTWKRKAGGGLEGDGGGFLPTIMTREAGGGELEEGLTIGRARDVRTSVAAEGEEEAADGERERLVGMGARRWRGYDQVSLVITMWSTTGGEGPCQATLPRAHRGCPMGRGLVPW